MNKILKIVGGPLKGAEIALVGGTRVKVGSGDGCDILVADPTLGETAFELEVSDDEVTLTTPDGAAKTLLDFEAREFGASAFAIGPAEGVWQEIVWPEKRAEEPAEAKDESPAAEDAKPEAEAKDESPAAEDAKPEEKDAGQETEDGEPASYAGWLVPLVIFILVTLLGWLLWRHRERVTEIWRGWFPDREAEAARIEAAKPTIGGIAAKYGVRMGEEDGKTVLTGNFRTRAERLRATGEAYAVQPGVELDFTDDESLLSAAESLLKLVTDGRVTVLTATNRVLALKGYAASPDALHDILVALNADVPGVERADCRAVTCGTGESEDKYDVPQLPGVTPKPRKAKSVVQPNLPVCGILTTPYPCLILKSGARIVEGGEFGGCVIERITSDAVTLRNTAGSFEWRP